MGILSYLDSLCGIPMTTLACCAGALLIALSGGGSDAGAADSFGRVEVRHDPAVFTASLLLNLTGYDEENADAFHPVRERTPSCPETHLSVQT